jgi:2-isopropylmalate synthase
MSETNSTAPEYRVFDFVITTGNTIKSTATVTLGGKLGKTVKTRYGDGPIDAAYDAINKALRLDLSRSFDGVSEPDIKDFWRTRSFELMKFDIRAVTEGKDSLGETDVTLRYENASAIGTGLDNDIVYSAIKAYIAAVNELVPAIRADIAKFCKSAAATGGAGKGGAS